MEQTFLYVMQLLLIATSSSKSLLNCEKALPTLAELEGSILTELSDSGPVIEDSIQYICLAQGNVQGMYRAASVIITYHSHRGGPTKVRHFHVHCYNNAWLIDDGEPSHHHHHHLGSHATRSDCRQCNRLYNITNCIECSKKCFSNDVCCSYYKNGMQYSTQPSMYKSAVPRAVATPTPTSSVKYCSQCKGSCCQSCSAYTINGCSSVSTTVTNESPMLNLPRPPRPPSCSIPNCAVCDSDCCKKCKKGYVLDVDECTCIAINTATTSTAPMPPSDPSDPNDPNDPSDPNDPNDSNDPNNPNDPNDRNGGGSSAVVPGILTGVVFAIVIGMLVLLTTLALISYLLYYLYKQYNRARYSIATIHALSPDMQFQENPLYLTPAEIIGDTTRLL